MREHAGRRETVFHKKRAGPIAGPFTRKRRYCFIGALDDAAAGVFEAFTAFLFATLFELAGLAVVDLGAFLTFLVEVVLVVEFCGAAGVLCANIAAAVNIEIRIMRFIFVSPCGVFPLANPSCGRTLFQTLAPAGSPIAPPHGIHNERLLMKKR
jgi:hypothetical protein